MFRLPVLAAFAFAALPLHAETLTVRYDFPDIANYELMWGYFGGEFGPVTGQIVSTTLVIDDYTPTGAQDAADFYFTFDVPTSDGVETHIGLTGADLGWSGQGAFDHSFTTDLYNGTIREGRFAAEFAGGGQFVGESYIEFVVEADPLDPLFVDGFDPP